MRCNVVTCPNPATRAVLLTSQYVQMTRAFCAECAARICARTEGIIGTDIGPIHDSN